MKKQINLKIDGNQVIALMNDKELFKLSSTNKTIDIEDLYKKLSISKEDTLQNMIQENNSENKSTIEIIYDNTKCFLDELIKKINETISQFDVVSEENILINQ